MKIKLVLVMALSLFCLVSYSQGPANSSTKNSDTAKGQTLEEKMEGTYVIINKSTKVMEVLTTSILPEIEKRRAENDIVYYDYSPNITIKILPKRVINAPGFDPKKNH